MKTETHCKTCGGTLRQWPCGCWIGRDMTRWCPGAKTLHAPAGSRQPERCEGQ